MSLLKSRKTNRKSLNKILSFLLVVFLLVQTFLPVQIFLDPPRIEIQEAEAAGSWVVGSGGNSWSGNVAHNSTTLTGSNDNNVVIGIKADFFNRANNQGLGSGWYETHSSFGEIYENYLRTVGSAALHGAIYQTNFSGNRTIAVKNIGNDQAATHAIYLNTTSSAFSGNYIRYSTSGAYIKMHPGTIAPTGGSGEIDINDGDILKIIISSSDVKMYINENYYVGSWSTVLSPGYVGVYTFYSGNTWGIDDFRIIEDELTSGTLTSISKDAESIAADDVWKQISFTGTVSSPTTTVNLEINSSDDNSNWDGWAAVQTDAVSGTTYDIPEANQKQYGKFRLTLNTTDSSQTPEIQAVTLTSAAGNTAPTTSSSNLSFLDNLYPGTTSTFTVIYTDTDGATDLNHLHLKIDHPSATDIEYYAIEGTAATGLTPTAVSGSDYVTTVTYDRAVSGNNITITWNFELDWDWTDSTDIEFGVYATDDSDANSGWDTTTTANKIYDNELTFSGTLAASGSTQGSLTDGVTWVPGGETISWSGLTVIYEGSAVSPDESDFNLQITDDDTGSWTQSTGTVLSLNTTADAATDTTDIHNIDIIDITSGGTDTSTETFTIKVDTATPNIIVIDAGPSSADRISLTSDTWFKYTDTGSDDQLSFQWTDPNSTSDDTFCYELNSISTNTITGDESNTTNPYIDEITITEGTNYFHVRPRNGSDTWGTERIFIVKYDKTNPAISLASPNNNSFTGDNTPTLTWSGSDATSGISYYQLYIDNSLDTNNITNTSTTPANNLSCGNHTWYVRAYDNINNYTDSNTFNLTISCGSGFIPSTPPVVPATDSNQTFEITIINNEQTINLSKIENVYQIAISTTPDFKYVSWEPYKENITLPNTNKVYLKFRSPTGGVSEVYEVENTNSTNNNTNTTNLSNGSLIKAINDFKVYIINNNYIRHILDGKIFNFYNHLNWESIQEVTSTQLNNYQESYLIRGVNDYKVYEIENNKKHWLDITVEEFINSGRKWEEVYVVNGEELGWYEEGE